MSKPETPALDHLKSVMEETEIAAQFLDWLQEQDITLTEIDATGYEYFPITESKDHLLARWKGVDLKACEKERQAVLDHFRKQQFRS